MKHPTRRQVIHSTIKPQRTYLQGLWECLRCGHRWFPRRADYQMLPKPLDRPEQCPGCHRRNWWIQAGILQKQKAGQ